MKALRIALTVPLGVLLLSGCSSVQKWREARKQPEPPTFAPTTVFTPLTVDDRVTVDAALLQRPTSAFRLGPGDYALIPVGVPHRWRNEGADRVRWAEMQGPVPRGGHEGDTLLVPELPGRDDILDVDVRDPRTRRFGHIEPVHMEPGRQDQASLAVSASMRTAARSASVLV